VGNFQTIFNARASQGKSAGAIFSPLILSFCLLSFLLALPLLFFIGCQGSPQCPINGQRAFKHVEKLVSFGPHPSGSKALGDVQTYIRNHLTKSGLQVMEKDFLASTPIGSIPMKNIIGILEGKRSQIIMLATHYDTKRFSEFKFVGANDGCSGTGLLLELAAALAAGQKKPDCSLWFVFFDGEEAILQWSSDDSLYGSRHLVKELKEQGSLSLVRSVILLDMVGDQDLTICREAYSTKWLQDLIWSVASQMNYQQYFRECSQQVMDDHWPLLQEGISAVDIIDFQYGGSEPPGVYWHTAQDTLDKVSAESLQVVGEVVYKSIFQVQKALFGKMN